MWATPHLSMWDRGVIAENKYSREEKEREGEEERNIERITQEEACLHV
jgi:hypothetical protein